MAITKLMHMKSAKKGPPSSHLKNAIEYILQEKKVARNPETQQQYAGTQGCLMGNAYRDMLQTKEQYGKTDGRQGYHFIISFKPGEVSKDQIWKITQGFVKEYLKGYEAVYAIHDDKEHLHAHIVFNSVNYETGYKYHYCNGDWEKDIQPAVDRLCMENGAPTLAYHVDEYDEDGIKKQFYTYSKNFSWTKEVKSDIDGCIKTAGTWEEFANAMKQRGYSINYGKSVSVRKAGMKMAKRLKEKTMGYEYTPEGIIERIHIKNGKYRLKSAGTVISDSRQASRGRRKRAFRSYRDMDFREKVMVRHMLRLRAAIPEYKASPGSWYAKRKAGELRRIEKELMLVRKYGISGSGSIKMALADLGSKEDEIKRTVKHQEFISREYGELIDAYKKAMEYESGGAVTYSEYKEAKLKIDASPERMEDIGDYIKNAEGNRERYKTEIKNIKGQKAILMKMLEKEQPMGDKEKQRTANKAGINMERMKK